MKTNLVLALVERLLSKKPVKAFIAAIFALWLVHPAYAHHPLEGREPETFNFIDGLISGLAHPVFGTDHLLFLLSIGLVSALSLKRWLPLLLVTGCAGTILSSFSSYVIPEIQIVVGLSLLVAAFVSLGFVNPLLILPLICCHGYVLGESIIGSEPTPLFSYCLGLIISQAVIICSGFGLFRYFERYKLFL